jgi:hypothetical protein
MTLDVLSPVGKKDREDVLSPVGEKDKEDVLSPVGEKDREDVLNPVGEKDRERWVVEFLRRTRFMFPMQPSATNLTRNDSFPAHTYTHCTGGDSSAG